MIKFSDQSAGNPTAWQWDLGDGRTVFVQNPATTYFNPGTYTVSLRISNANGRDSITKTALIRVYPRPAVNFLASVNDGCFPLPVQFTDLSSGMGTDIVAWQWDFGDGESSSEKNPLHTYRSAGNYNVSLRTTTVNGCEQTLTRPAFIRIAAGVSAGFEFSAPQSCATPIRINFKDTSRGTGTLSYRWDFGDNIMSSEKNPQHLFTNPGLYTVRLTVRNDAGCVDSFASAPISLGQVRADFIIPDKICAGSPILFENSSAPGAVTANWNFGDGNSASGLNAQHIFQQSGIYQVTMKAEFGTCQQERTKSVEVLAAPAIDFTADRQIFCSSPGNIQFTALGEALSWEWDFGDGGISKEKNSEHSFLGRRQFTVSLRAENEQGCVSTVTKPNFISHHIKPSFETPSRTECAPFLYKPVLYQAEGDPIKSFYWNFDDGSFSDDLFPEHQYLTEGTFHPRIVYTTEAGCTDSAFDMVVLSKKPTPKFSASPPIACGLEPVSFIDSTEMPVTGWEWFFGDGGGSLDQFPTHIYQDTGYFDVTLIAWNFGCSDTLVLKDFIYMRPPISRFSDSIAGCDDKFTRHFIDESIGATGWHWDFGDNNSSNEQNPVHRYDSAGVYIVTLRVTNDTCEHIHSRYIVVSDERADFEISDPEACRGLPVRFTALSVNPDFVSSFKWYIGNNIGFGPNYVNSFSDTGTYTVSLVVTDVHGCTDSLGKQDAFKVFGPIASFNIPEKEYCADEELSISDASKPDSRSPIKYWIWNYGDGQIDTATGPPFGHAYAKGGNYRVRLTVVDSSGCSDETWDGQFVSVNKPIISFSSSDTVSCADAGILFENQSTGQQLKFFWNFGDGNSSVETSPRHRYAEEGSYNVSLSAVDQFGCSDSLSRPEYIAIKNPVALIQASDSVATCPPLVVNFSHSSKNFSTQSWDFGDQTSSILNAPGHFYSFPGTYRAVLTVSSPGGCIDSAAMNIVVRGPEGSFRYNSDPACAPGSINFFGSTGDKASFIWDFNDGTVMDGDSVISYTYESPGEYLPRMILVDPDGCRVPISGQDTIRVLGAVGGFTHTNSLFCDSAVVAFQNNSKSNEEIKSYRWNFGDGNFSNLQDPVHLYRAPGNYSVSLFVETESGCRDTVAQDQTISIFSSPLLEISGDTSACIPASPAFIAGSDQANLSLNWNFGNGMQFTDSLSVRTSYEQEGLYQISLQAENAAGCRDTAYFNFAARPVPEVNAGRDQTVCLGESATLQATGADQYLWQGPGLNCTDCETIVISPKQESIYYLEGENIFGCRAGDSVIIEVKKPFTLEVSAEDTICIGEQLQLWASGAELYEWTPASLLSNAGIGNPTARPASNTIFQVIGGDEAGCFSDTAAISVQVYPIPAVDAGDDQVIGSGDMLLLKADLSPDITKIRWSPPQFIDCVSCAETNARPKRSTTFRIDVENEGGCKNHDELNVHVFCSNTNLFVPNTFTPNGDGFNDRFFPRGKGVFSIRMFRVFNRWGEIVFEKSNFQANNASDGWDGNFRGRAASQDVYVYTLELICENQEILRFKGNIALMR